MCWSCNYEFVFAQIFVFVYVFVFVYPEQRSVQYTCTVQWIIYASDWMLGNWAIQPPQQPNLDAGQWHAMQPLQQPSHDFGKTHKIQSITIKHTSEKQNRPFIDKLAEKVIPGKSGVEWQCWPHTLCKLSSFCVPTICFVEKGTLGIPAFQMYINNIRNNLRYRHPICYYHHTSGSAKCTT